MTKYINFDIDSVEIEDEENEDSQFATAKITVFSSKDNAHDLYCSEETLQKTAHTLDNVPILYNFDSMMGSYDFGTHTDADKSLIAGFAVPGTQTFFEFVDEKGTPRMGLNIFAKVWKRYVPNVIKIFREKKQKSVSVEMDLLASQPYQNGLTEMLDFVYQGICLLGDLVTPAAVGAGMEMLSFAAKENSEYRKNYEKEFAAKPSKLSQAERYANIDFTIPIEVKESVKLALEKNKETSRASAVVLAVARHLLNSSSVNFDKIRYIYKSMSRKMSMEFEEGSSEHDEFMLMGGNLEWASKLVEEMNMADKEKSAYFGVNNEKKEVKNSMDEIEEKKEEMAAEMMAADTKEEEKVETPSEEKKESEAEQKEEAKEEVEMSLDAYLDVAAAEAFLKSETEDYEELVQEFAKEEKNWAFVAKSMFGVAQKMAAKYQEMCGKFAAKEEEERAYMAENSELKKFKADIESRQFMFEVDTTLKEIENAVEMPKEDFASLREESAKFSLETVDAWKNLARAKAFTFAAKIEKKDEIARYAIVNQNGSPFVGNGNSGADNGSPWKL